MAWVSIGVVVLAAGGAGLFLAVQGRRFERRVGREARALHAASRAGPPAPPSLGGLPPPVRRYMEVSCAAARAPVSFVRLRHGGSIRPALEKPWSAIRGVQFFSADPPGFVWWGRIRLAPGLWVDARDRSVAGEGNMLVQIVSTLTIADARGPELDEGALMRLLGEMVWFPTAFLDGRHVTWAPVDDTSARATLRVGGREVTATFRFGPDGLPTGLVAERYRDVGGKGVLTPWTGEYRDHREVDGLRVPFRTEVSWRVEGEPRPYARWELDEVEYDPPPHR